MLNVTAMRTCTQSASKHTTKSSIVDLHFVYSSLVKGLLIRLSDGLNTF